MIAYPGPKAKAIIERMRAVEGAGPRTGDGDPLVVDHASGSTLVDPDGNSFVDLAGSFAASTIGHSHPDVVAAVAAQIGVASHVSSAAVSEQRVAFEEDLVAIAPPGLDRVLLGISGADANDTALKLARTMTGRREVLAFSGGYFGRSGGVVGVNGKAAFRTSVGRDAEAHFLPYPDAYRWPTELGGPALACEGALALVRTAIEDPASGIGPLAAIVVEPVQGNGGIVVPPDGFLQGLRALCDTPRHPARVRRDPVRVRADRPTVGGGARRRRAGSDDRRQGHRRRAGAVRRRRAVRGRCSTGRPARTRRRSSGTPSTWRPAGPRSR